MATTLQRQKSLHGERKRAQEKLALYAENGSLYYAGGIPLLTGEMGIKLYPAYLNEVGRENFLEKIKARDWQEQDAERVAMFLIRHGIQPSAENCFRLVMGARLDVIFASKPAPSARSIVKG